MKEVAMLSLLLLTLQASWLTSCLATHHYSATWGHYDLCKSQGYSDEGLTWYYMACQPEAADMTKYLKVTLDPPNVTCGDPPENYCALPFALRTGIGFYLPQYMDK
ncbi:hypothetical protein DNTS_028287 [Danionella cerebrum]|uniref:Uncharacterized protein n=1 Tax=Danionella cerebrum TaxID=2873325 RepID=A0A553NL55_9TELE|nr:hypothetical protein DNTS_028287 [Danionella translucida]